MFRELMPLLKERTVMITLSRLDDATIRVCVIPKRLKEDTSETAEENALCAPLAVTGTLDELDREFGSEITRYTHSVVKLGSNFAEIEAAHEAATKVLKEEKKKDLDRQRGKPAGSKATANAPAKTQGPVMKDGKPVFGSKDGQSSAETKTLFDTEAQAADSSQTPEQQAEPAVSGSEEEVAISAAETNASQPTGSQEQTAFTYPD